MKRLLFILSCIMPLWLTAQDDKEPDMSKYLSGTVPTENGKVVFAREIPAPGLTQEQVYNIALSWLENTLRENRNKSGIIYKDEKKGEIAGASEHYMVFKSTAFSLDRATVYYRIMITAFSGKCDIEMNGIRYMYNGAQKNVPDRYTAEELITDKMALNKAGTKMYNMPGKFRTKTIDKAEELFAGLQTELESGIVKALGGRTATAPDTPSGNTVTQGGKTAVTVTPPAISAGKASEGTSVSSTSNNSAMKTHHTTSTGITAPVSPTAATSVSGTSLEGYKNIPPDKIPGNIIKMLSEDWMLITAGNDGKFNTMTASWGGLGVLYNKPVAICFINPARYTYSVMENNDTYTLTFYTEIYRDVLNYCGSVSGRDTDKIKGSGLTPLITPDGSMAFSQAWMIIECRKLVSQSLSPDAIHDAKEREKRSSQAMHKMYIGEIINVWVK